MFASAELMDDVVYAKEFDLNKEQLHHAIVEGFQTKSTSLDSSNTTANDYEKINNGNIEWFQFDSTMTKIERYYHDETNSNPAKQGTNSRPSSGMVKEVIDPKDYHGEPGKFTAMYGSTHPESNISNSGVIQTTSMILTMTHNNKCFCILHHQVGHEDNGRIVIDKDETHMVDIAALIKDQYGSPWNVTHQNVAEYKDINGQVYYYLSYTEPKKHGFLIITYNINGEIILIQDYMTETNNHNKYIYGDNVSNNQLNQTLLDITLSWSNSIIEDGHITIYTTNRAGNPPSTFTSNEKNDHQELYATKIINITNIQQESFNGIKSWCYSIGNSKLLSLGEIDLTWPENDPVMTACHQHDYLIKFNDISSTNINTDLWNVQKQKLCLTNDGKVVSLDFKTNTNPNMPQPQYGLTSKISTSKDSYKEKIMPFLSQIAKIPIINMSIAKNRVGFSSIFLHDNTGNLWISRQSGLYTDGTTEQKTSDPYGIEPVFEAINGVQTPIFTKATCLGNFDMVYVPDRFTEDSEYAYIKNDQVYLAHNTYITKTWVSDKLEIYDNAPIAKPTESKGKFYHLNIVPEDVNGQPTALSDSQYIEIRAPYPMTIIDMSTHTSYRSDRYSPIYFKIKSATGKLNLAIQAKDIGCYVYARFLDINSSQTATWQNFNLSAFAHQRLSKLPLSQVQSANLPYKSYISKAKSEADKQVSSYYQALGQHLTTTDTSAELTIQSLGSDDDPLAHISMGNSQAAGIEVNITDSSVTTQPVASSTSMMPENIFDTIGHAVSDACHWIEHHIIDPVEKAIQTAVKFVDNTIHLAFEGMESMFDALGLSVISQGLKCLDQICQTALNTLGSLLTLPLKILDISLELI